jgi:hypothetical protein
MTPFFNFLRKFCSLKGKEIHHNFRLICKKFRTFFQQFYAKGENTVYVMLYITNSISKSHLPMHVAY